MSRDIKRKVGRPSKYSEELIDAICRKVSEGQALLHVCEEEGFPTQTTVFRWLNEKEEFREKYARAREIQIERMALDALRIADDPNPHRRRSADGIYQRETSAGFGARKRY